MKIIIYVPNLMNNKDQYYNYYPSLDAYTNQNKFIENEDLYNRLITLTSICPKLILAGSFSNYLLKRAEGIYLSIPHFEIPLLNQFLVNAGVGLINVESRNSLEDYFLQVTSNTQ